MTREETIHELGEWLEQMIQHGVPSHSAKRKALATAIALLSAEAADVYKAHEEEHLEIINRIKELQYAIAKTQTIVGKVVESADAVCEDTQTEERARFIAKETELAHIEAKLENAEKRLQGACTANFVAEQLDRLRNMTDEERWDFFIKFFSPSADTVSREFYEDAVKANIGLVKENRELKEQIESAEAEKTYIGIDIPYGSDKGIATFFKRKDDKLILEEVKELMRSWIPCSERLPEVGEICLLTVHEYGWNCKDNTRVIIGEYSDNYADHILAWMPLPDPYTEMEP